MEPDPVLHKTAAGYEAAGRLDPVGFDRHIDFRTYSPPAHLAAFVEHFWILSWDRANQLPYDSVQVMHRPYVDVYVAKQQAGIQCTFLGKRVYQAANADRIVGARFRPGAFHAFWLAPLNGLADSTIPIDQVFPQADQTFIAALNAAGDTKALKNLGELIASRQPATDDKIELVNEILAAVENNETLHEVPAVAQAFLRSERWLQQLFANYLGVGLKWFLQRLKLLAAARFIREHDQIDWADLAYDRGYSSQQHFIHDFKRVLGQTPAQYQKALKQSG